MVKKIKTESQKTAKKVPQKQTVPKPIMDQQFLNQAKTSFSIVGIGASAGGLEAFESLFKAIPADSGAAFVVVSHLDPNHVSILPELIQKKTPMCVNLVSDDMKVVPNQVFIIPPNKEMILFNGKLQLLEMSTTRSSTLPIDIFFRSLAQDQKEKAIGIILSGTGTDGTIGVRAIKGEGGMVISQDINSDKYDGMPTSAVATSLVDYILTPDKMPAQLLNYINCQSRKPVVFSDANNVTECRKIQQARKPAAIVEDSNDAISLLNFSGKILAWNKGAENIYNYSESEALTINILDIVPPHRKKQVFAYHFRTKKEVLTPWFSNGSERMEIPSQYGLR